MTKRVSVQNNSAPEWNNWSGNLVHEPPTSCEPYYFMPTTEDELRDVLTQAKTAGVKVRASGQRHSQPPLVAETNRGAVPADPTVFLVDMSCYKDLGPLKDQDMVINGNTVTVNAGVREDALDAFLTENNLIMKTVTAGGFFSVGGMTAVDVNGATVKDPIFAETASAFTLMRANGSMKTVNSTSTDDCLSLQFIRVSLGAFGIVTSITLDVLPRPWATTLVPSRQYFGAAPTPFSFPTADEVKAVFIDRMGQILTEHDRVETFFNPYSTNVIDNNFMALIWDLVDPPAQEIPNPSSDPTSACVLAGEDEFGAPYLPPLAEAAAETAGLLAQTESKPHLASLLNTVGFKTIAAEVDAANDRYSDLWLTAPTPRVIFMSYYVPLPGIDAAGLAHAWEGLQVVFDTVTQDDTFHIATPMEFRFIRGGDSTFAGTFTTEQDVTFINLDLVGFVAKNSSGPEALDYPPELLKFFADVERKWVELGGLPHNGKTYGFYDPTSTNLESFTPPFNPNFIRSVTQQRIDRGAPVQDFKNCRQTFDPDGLFENAYLQTILDV